MLRAKHLLQGAIRKQDERAAERGVTEERVMDKIVAGFNGVTGHNLTTSDGWLFMQFLKVVRAREGKHFREDDHHDNASYASLWGEEIAREKPYKEQTSPVDHT